MGNALALLPLLPVLMEEDGMASRGNYVTLAYRETIRSSYAV